MIKYYETILHNSIRQKCKNISFNIVLMLTSQELPLKRRAFQGSQDEEHVQKLTATEMVTVTFFQDQADYPFYPLPRRVACRPVPTLLSW